MNLPPTDSKPELDERSRSSASAADIPDDAPTLDEVKCAVRKMKNGQGLGTDKECFGHRIDCTSEQLSAACLLGCSDMQSIMWPKHSLQYIIWCVDWRDGIIISLF